MKFSIYLVIVMACLILFASSTTKLPAQISERPALAIQTEMKALTPSATPQFTAPIRIKANGVDMKVDTYTSVPCAVDWNQDGKKDLLVGSFYYGNVYFFNNSGTNIIPVFTSGVKLKTDGLDISVAYG